MNYQAQLTLLADILKNQRYEGYGTQDEMKQLQRLAKSLHEQNLLDSNMQQIFDNINAYCVNGNCPDLAVQIDHWLQAISDFSVPEQIE